MLEVTERAIAQLSEMREQNGLEPNRGVGIVPDEGGHLQFAAVEAGPADQVIERAGEPIMVVPAALSDTLNGMILDWHDAPDTQQFTLTRSESGGPEAPAGAGPDRHE